MTLQQQFSSEAFLLEFHHVDRAVLQHIVDDKSDHTLQKHMGRPCKNSKLVS